MPARRAVLRVGVQGRGVSGELCASLEGFSLHAKVALEAHDHEGRERLARHLTRPPIASERLSLAEDGRVVYALRRHWKDGTRAVAFEPLDFIARLAALVPRPKTQAAQSSSYLGKAAPGGTWRRSALQGGLLELVPHAMAVGRYRGGTSLSSMEVGWMDRLFRFVSLRAVASPRRASSLPRARAGRSTGRELRRLGSIYGVLALLAAAPAWAQAVRLNGPLALGVAGDVVEAAISPDGSRVVYLADQDADERYELYGVALAGGPAIRLNPALAAGGDVQAGFRITPDSSRVVYLADQDANDVVELFSASIAGGPAIQLNSALVAGGDVRSFVLSPDGSRVVYRADQDAANRIELYSVPVAGGAAVRLNAPLVASGDVLNAADVRVSPDSSRVVYRADQDADQVFELFSVPLAGGAATQLNPVLATGGDVEAGFEIGPDSSRVVYLADQAANDVFELFSVPLAGGAATALHPPLAAGGDVQAGFQIAPDSSRVAYVGGPLQDGRAGLFSAPLAGGAEVHLDEDVVPILSIAPDSSRVVYLGFPGTFAQLFSVPLAGGSPVMINPVLASGAVEGDFQISPDSSTVVYRASLPPGGGLELASAPIAGGPSQLLCGSLDATEQVSAFVIAPDSGHVAYLADQDSDGVQELFGVPLAGGAVVQLNPQLVQGGDVQGALLVSADSSRVVYLADQSFDEVVELHGVPIGGGAATKLNPVLAPSATTVGDVTRMLVSPDRRRVVYLADEERDEEFGLFSVELPAGRRLRIDAAVSVDAFAITPDSARVVYSGDSQALLRSVSIAGGASTTLDPSFPASAELGVIRFSPDSSRVLFLADTDGDAREELYSLPIGGGTAVRLSGASGGVQFLEGLWPGFLVSPDSSRVVYHADEDVVGVAELFTVPVSGGAATKLNPPLAAPRDIRPAFAISPDSSRVVYYGDVLTAGVVELFSVPLAGGASVRLNADLAAGGDVVSTTSPVISPDSSRVVYGADQETDGIDELYSVPLAGGPATRLNSALVPGGEVLVAQGVVSGLVVSPDSSRVLYLADQDDDGVVALHVVPIDGNAAPLAIGWHVGLVPTELPYFGLNLVPPRISPDGARVVYMADQDQDLLGRFELYSVPITGGTAVTLSAFLPSGEALAFDFAITADSAHVLYRAGHEPTKGARLHGARIDGSTPPKELNSSLAAGGQVYAFAEARGGAVYLADQDEAGVYELYLSFLTRPHRRAR